MSLLPKIKTSPKQTLFESTILLYGGAKAGKSTFCSQANKALFFATEAGLNHLNTYQIPISNWEELSAASKEIEKGNHEFKTIIIDTVDNAYRYCSEYICKKFGIKHESDLGYSKGYALVKNEFHRVLTKLSQLPTGLILVSHAQEREIDSRTGKYTKIMPSLPEGAKRIIIGMVDIIGFVDLEEKVSTDGQITYNRVIRTKPSRHYEAGDRTGKLPETLPLDYQVFEKSLKTALTGKQTKSNQTKIIPDKKDLVKPVNNNPAAKNRETENRVIVNRKPTENK